eukprot:5394847-Pleurochrysis_carterae.AAC.1
MNVEVNDTEAELNGIRKLILKVKQNGTEGEAGSESPPGYFDGSKPQGEGSASALLCACTYV